MQHYAQALSLSYRRCQSISNLLRRFPNTFLSSTNVTIQNPSRIYNKGCTRKVGAVKA
jgi:hypothetical protein